MGGSMHPTKKFLEPLEPDAEVMTEGFLGGELYGISCGFGGGQSEHVAFQMPDAGR